MTQSRSIRDLTSSIGRALFLAGIFLMVTGDWPRATLLQTRWVMPLNFLAWPWLYLTLLAASFVFLVSGGVLKVGRSTTADFLHAPLALLTAAFLLSLAFSQVPWLSEWAFGSFLAVVGFALAVARVVDDETCTARMPFVIAMAALCLAVRVVMYRFDEGMTSEFGAYHVRNNAWLGKIQISWVLNLAAPLLLARFFEARTIAPALCYGVTWLLDGAGIYLLFSRAGALAFSLTTLSLCVLNAHYWRRWLPLLAGSACLAFAVIAATTTLTTLVASVLDPARLMSAVVRLDLWRQTVRMIVDHPVIGIGFGTYDDIAHSRYGPIADPWFFRRGWHAHNTHLHILAETGMIGFLAWCYLWFTIVRFLLRQWRAGDTLGRLNSSAVLCVLLAFFVLSMTESLTAARLHASLRMNLTLTLLVMFGIRLAARTRFAPPTDGEHGALPLPRP